MLTGPPCAHFFVRTSYMSPDLTSPPQITVRCRQCRENTSTEKNGGREERRPSHITHMADTPPVPESTWPLTTHRGVRRGVGASPPGLQLALRVRFRASMSAARGCGCRGVCSSEASEASTAGRGAMPLAGAPGRARARARRRAAGGGVSLCMSMSTVHCATAWAGGGGAWELGRTPRTHTHTHTIQKLFAR